MRLNSVVSRIEVHPKGVSITTADEKFDAEVVVVTLPLGVLKRHGVEFTPQLPESRLGAIDRLGSGSLNKVAIRFPRVFWPAKSEYFEVALDSRQDGRIAEAECASCHKAPAPRETPGFAEFVNMAPVNGEAVLVALTGGPFAHRIESWSDDRIQSNVMEAVRVMFGSGSPDPFGMIVSRWHTDPFSGGAYPHVPVGATMRDFDILASPIGARLFFAGDSTHSRYPGTVHGAYLSGLRAADEAITALDRWHVGL